MRSLRILVATHSPLLPEFGAGQMAINLAEALREQGHLVTLWSPYPLPDATRWWQGIPNLYLMRSKLNAFIASQPPFDVIDCYAMFITAQVAQSALVVARSVQPEILYITSQLFSPQRSKLKELALLAFNCLFAAVQIFLLLQGWRRAKFILCLGSLEFEWMKKWFPFWKEKLTYYVNALSPIDQAQLAEIRLNRKKPEQTRKRFLWMGRWVAHKGTAELVDFIDRRAASHPHDTFTIAGCGIAAERDLPSKLIQSGRVKVLRSFQRSELFALLSAHDVGLFTSRIEGWGLVLNEMLESGMPLFATPAGGVLDLQPFWKSRIQGFPPPVQLSDRHLANYNSDNQEIDGYINDYYKVFSWENIAQSYIEFILPRLNSK